MRWIVHNLWLIPAIPLAAAALISVTRKERKRMAIASSIGAMALSLLLSVAAFVQTLGGDGHGGVFREVFNFRWFDFGTTAVSLGWVLDPLTASMLVMVSFVSLLIFIYSAGYMAHDENITRFFGFLSLFAAAMLGLVIANSLLLLFMCWELVGLASYLLIGFWFHKPSAAAAAKKAFITTRIGDIAFFVGILWLYAGSGTLLFYDQGNGCLEQSALGRLIVQTTFEGMAVSTAIGLLIFCGAAGKSGQVPLHVWLPDAMEGPTPVSALIHAATMVAAGVFLVARVYPLLEVDLGNGIGQGAALSVIAWVGAITAVFAALIAVAQTDIKRILAYSTVSQLGYMMLALGVGGYAAGVFHLLTHAFFKALLFLGAGSVIHGCHEEQDIRRMGGLRRLMPITFATYAIGMMALAGIPVFFSGFWSKDEILHSAYEWPLSHGPFLLGLAGAFLTAFYMTRQMSFVFFGEYRGESAAGHAHGAAAHAKGGHGKTSPIHESPPVMTVPLRILAVGAVLLGVIGTPAWPWFHGYLTGHYATLDVGKLFERSTLLIMGLSTVAVGFGILLGWRLYGRKSSKKASDLDALEKVNAEGFALLREKFRVDEIYDATIVAGNLNLSRFCQWLDESVATGAVRIASMSVLALSWLNRSIDELLINGGFDQGCKEVRRTAGGVSQWQGGQIQKYLWVLALSAAVIVIAIAWGGGR
jgi:NADH-quinone oxidoreductase subunit L